MSLNQSKRGGLERLLHKASDGYTAIVRHINNIFKVGKLIRFQLVQKKVQIRYESKRISNGALVAPTLMIAESRTEEKDTMVKMVVNLINNKNHD